MSSLKSVAERDCSRKCRVHGDIINQAITKRAVNDNALASFMKLKCGNYIQSVDGHGRSSLHMAASCGKYSLLEWIAKQCSKQYLNLRDLESGYTALHRSIFYGQIHSAVLLCQLGIDMDILDNQDLRAIDHALYDRIPGTFKHTMQPAEAYVWGSNTNYTLGTVSQQQRKVPELVSSITNQKGQPENIIQVCLGKFHSIWVCAGGGVWACGQAARCTGSLLKTTSGIGTRAGEMLVNPRQLKLPEPCAQAAVTLYGTVLLFNSGAVMQYGEDSHSSKVLLHLEESGWTQTGTGGIRACRTGCIAWGPQKLYSWGNNRGNLGHDTNYMHLPTPRVVTCIQSGRKDDKTTLLCADICDVATVVANSRGDVYLLHNYQGKKILTKQQTVIQVRIDASDNGPITVLLLTSLGFLYHWQDSTCILSRCCYSLNRPIYATDMGLSKGRVLFTTTLGEAFFGNINSTPLHNKKSRESKSNIYKFQKFLSFVQLERLSNIYRAVRVAKDFESANFAILQASGNPNINHNSKGPPLISPSTMTMDMFKLKEEKNLADVIFMIGKRQFPAHIFVIAHHSDILYNLYKDSRGSDFKLTSPIIRLPDIHPDIFENLLVYFYTGNCDLLKVGKCSVSIKSGDQEKSAALLKDAAEDVIADVSAFEVHQKQQQKKTLEKTKKKNQFLNPLRLLQDVAKKFQVDSLGKVLDKYSYKDGFIRFKDNNLSAVVLPNMQWERSRFLELCDARIKCEGGSIIKAHQCMLSARLEYFSAMFANTWAETSTKSEISLPISNTLLEPIIRFVYTGDCPEILQSQSLEQVCSFLIVADQLFIARLTEMCEQRLSQMITLKNCSEMCQFADTYNATQLKQYCMEYIVINLYWYFENRALDILSDSLLEELSEFYRKSHSVMQCRIITPVSTAPSDEIILSCFDAAPINLDVDLDVDIINEEISRKYKSKTNKKQSLGNNERVRAKNESVGFVDSLDVPNSALEDSFEEKKDVKVWVKILSPQQKTVLARLKANSVAKEDKTILDMPNSHFINLAKSSNLTTATPTSVISLKDMVDSPTLGPQGSLRVTYSPVKLSQKQRKKMEAEQKLKSQEEKCKKLNIDNAKPVTPPPIVSPWKIISDQPIHQTKDAALQYFDDIINEEVKQKENLVKMRSKSLNLTQMEDRAIAELKRFYGALTAEEELITVKRNDSAKIAAPQWIQHRH